jgi:plasmid stabilization system protein ParE
LRLVWAPAALQDLEEAAAWSTRQAAAVVDAMERMATSGWSLGKPTRRPGIRYWPVPPLGVFYRVVGEELRVLQVVDVRRLLEAP